MDTSPVTLDPDIGKGGSEKLNKCNLCDYNSGQPGNLRTHIMNEHSIENFYNCTQCDFATVHAPSLWTHLKIHSGEKSYKCNQCDFASVRADNLRRQLKKNV